MFLLMVSALHTFPKQFKYFIPKFSNKISKQAGAELCQAQVYLEVVVEIGVEVEACHF